MESPRCGLTGAAHGHKLPLMRGLVLATAFLVGCGGSGPLDGEWYSEHAAEGCETTVQFGDGSYSRVDYCTADISGLLSPGQMPTFVSTQQTERGQFDLQGGAILFSPNNNSCPGHNAWPAAVPWHFNEIGSLVLAGTLFSRPKGGTYYSVLAITKRATAPAPGCAP